MDAPKGLITALVISMLVIATGFAGCRNVRSGYVGVQTTFGRVHDAPLQPGIHFVKPFIDGVVPMETRLKSFEVAASASSKDLQKITTVISVQHSLNGAMAPMAFSVIGDLDMFDVSVVSPGVLESLKAVTAQYTAEELITKRDVVKQAVSNAIQGFINHTLKDKGVLGAIDIANVAIKDFEFSAEFNQSIESKVKAQQDSLRAVNEKTRRITEAEASAREVELAADAAAYKIDAASIANAAAIERESSALAKNPVLVQLRAVEKWNGTLPRFIGAGQVMPIMDVKPALDAQQLTAEGE